MAGLRGAIAEGAPGAFVAGSMRLRRDDPAARRQAEPAVAGWRRGVGCAASQRPAAALGPRRRAAVA